MSKNKRSGGNFMIQKNDIIKAVYKSELEGFLESINILEDFKNAKIKCRYCGKAVTEENLFAFLPCGDHYEVCCDDSMCNIRFVQEANEAVD